jgi:DNA (cytosine-5)-methyltransferase 1
MQGWDLKSVATSSIHSLMANFVPVIDLFAGPGGLSEGFSRHHNWFGSDVEFRSVLSIEKSAPASKTLTLRTFFRKFSDGDLPKQYWDVVAGRLPETALHKFPEWSAAVKEVWMAELGVVPISELHGRIADRLGNEDNWLLLGGPPCQAYSLMGRARMTGIGHQARSASDPEVSDRVRQTRLQAFGSDVRHKLYQEYLRIIAVHQPAVFVMENVKGILSSKVPGTDDLMFDRIRADLVDPWAALAEDPNLKELERLSKPGRPKYRLFAFTLDGSRASDDNLKNRDFLIRSEDYGVPQKRHRVIVLGIREGIDVVPQPLRPSASATVRDAIGQLPSVRGGSSDKRIAEAEWKAERDGLAAWAAKSAQPKVAKIILEAIERNREIEDQGGRLVTAVVPLADTDLERWLQSAGAEGFLQHEARGHMPSDLARYFYMSASAAELKRSPMLEEWPQSLLPAHRNVAFNAKTGRAEVSGFSDRFKVQVWDSPSSTVTSHIAKDGHYFIHPDPAQNRSLTVREAARLQTFSDDYFFCGNRTEVFTQIGNAVPPYLGVQLAEVVAGVFRGIVQPATGREVQETIG